MRSIAGTHLPRHILLDYTHIFHLGYGIDASASSIVLLAMLGHWGEDRKLDTCLQQAYEQYDLWCKANHRTTSIDEFSRHAFGMGGCLNSRIQLIVFSILMPLFLCWPILHICWYRNFQNPLTAQARKSVSDQPGWKSFRHCVGHGMAAWLAWSWLAGYVLPNYIRSCFYRVLPNLMVWWTLS